LLWGVGGRGFVGGGGGPGGAPGARRPRLGFLSGEGCPQLDALPDLDMAQII
jgi:hypothetical protein